MKTLLAALLALGPALAAAEVTTWNIDPVHSSTSFAVKHLVVSTVRGQFTKTSGTIRYDEADPTRSSVEATIDATTVDTRNSDRDAHLKSPDFLDSARYPAIAFKSTKVERAGEKLNVTGDLVLHGVTRPVTLEVIVSPAVKGMSGEMLRGFSATGLIHRKDYGLVWNKAIEAGPIVGDDVSISIDAEAIKEQPKSAK